MQKREKSGGAIWGSAVSPVIGFYAALILVFVWMTKDLTVEGLTKDPLFTGYSVAVVFYILSRFAFSIFYKPVPDLGYRPTVSIIIPAFNEQDCIAETIESCLRVDYPDHLLEVVAVNDGSSDDTWKQILETKRRYPQLHAVDLGRNYGKRAAMAEGIRRSTGDILLFVDSDSFLDPEAVIAIAQPFKRPNVGAVVGHADVANAMQNWLTKMQQVRYYAAFRVIKGTESLLGGAVTCASGCCSAYRRESIIDALNDWEFQTFLGRPATFGDDRALTNIVLRHHRVVYQETAMSHTNVPETMRVFLRQQLRWKKSWLRESMTVCRYFWRKNPIAALFTYASIIFPLVAPLIVVRAVAARLFFGETGGLWFYLVGTYAMAMLYSLYYAFRRKSGLWHHGLSFVAIYMFALVFQTYWAMFTMRDNRWGTRTSSVTHDEVAGVGVTALQPSGFVKVPTPQSAPTGVTRVAPKRWGRQALAGLAMIPLTLIPFGMYFNWTPEGGLVWAKASVAVLPPRVGPLSEAQTKWAQQHAPDFEGPVALLVYHGIGRASDAEGSAQFTISPQRFAEQLSTLRAAGMNAVTATDVALAFSGLRKLPANAVMISFDDGRTDAMLYADPVLEQLRMKATMFAISSAASDSGIYYEPWKDLASHSASGRWDIQSHSSNSHLMQPSDDGRELPALTSLAVGESPDAYRLRISQDLSASVEAIGRNIGVPPVTFAYPFGAYGTDDRSSSGAAKAVAKTVRAKFALAFNQDDQSSWPLASCDDNPLTLRRLEVGDWTGRALLSRVSRAAAKSSTPRCMNPDNNKQRIDRLPAEVAKRLRAVDKMIRTTDDTRAGQADDLVVAFSDGDATRACPVVGADCAPVSPERQQLIDEVAAFRRSLNPRAPSSSRPAVVSYAARSNPSPATQPLQPTQAPVRPPTAPAPQSTPAPRTNPPASTAPPRSTTPPSQTNPPGQSKPPSATAAPPSNSGAPSIHANPSAPGQQKKASAPAFAPTGNARKP